MNPDAELLAQWLQWLPKALPSERAAWEARLQRKSLPPLPACVSAMLLFDAMCTVAMQSMHTADDAKSLRPFSEAIRAHLAMHAQLPFTSDAGRFGALTAVLEAQGFPEVICLQEAGELTKGSISGLKVIHEL